MRNMHKENNYRIVTREKRVHKAVLRPVSPFPPPIYIYIKQLKKWRLKQTRKYMWHYFNKYEWWNKTHPTVTYSTWNKLSHIDSQSIKNLCTFLIFFLFCNVYKLLICLSQLFMKILAQNFYWCTTILFKFKFILQRKELNVSIENEFKVIE